MIRRVLASLIAIVGVLALLFAARTPAAPPPHCDGVIDAEAVNVVLQMRSGDDGYEIDLWSREPFPMRAMPTVLRVGLIDTSRSSYGDVGSLNRITFYIDAEDFDFMRTGDPMLVHYGFISRELELNPDLAADAAVADDGNVWTFGRLDKSQLNCPPLPVPSSD